MHMKYEEQRMKNQRSESVIQKNSKLEYTSVLCTNVVY